MIVGHDLGNQRKKAIYRPRGLLHLAVKKDLPACSDTFETRVSVTPSKCHSNHIILIDERPFGTCQNCHRKRGVTVTGVTVSGEVCNGIACMSETAVCTAGYKIFPQCDDAS